MAAPKQLVNGYYPTDYFQLPGVDSQSIRMISGGRPWNDRAVIDTRCNG
jgi:hypothetical protein